MRLPSSAWRFQFTYGSVKFFFICIFFSYFDPINTLYDHRQINDFWVDLSDISAKKASLGPTFRIICFISKPRLHLIKARFSCRIAMFDTRHLKQHGMKHTVTHSTHTPHLFYFHFQRSFSCDPVARKFV